jgi:hypothetical protein
MTSLDLSLMVILVFLYCSESYSDILAESRGTLVGKDTINSVATVEHVTPWRIKNESTTENYVFYAGRAAALPAKFYGQYSGANSIKVFRCFPWSQSEC